LKHKPIYAIKRYEKVDGFYKNDTDVIGLSLGKAQWSNETFVPSVKVWRDVKTNNSNNYKISRQSEETTLTRALDLAMLVVRVYDSVANDKPVDSEIIKTVFGNLNIETVGNGKLVSDLTHFFTEENLDDVKNHIKILKDTIQNTKI
jgi:hypothetical protein